MIRLVCLLLGYAFGLIQTGFIVGKIKGIDIRKHGSGNSGSTNVLRTLGFRYAIIVFAFDALKCIAAVLAAKALFADAYPDILPILLIYTAFGVILGHNYPFYMGFKGGKGIASTGGFIISFIWQLPFGWVLTLLGIITFFGVFFATHYVSLGSLLLYVGLVIEMLIIGLSGGLDFPAEKNAQYLTEYYIILFILTALAFIRHKENIKRLLAGCERKTYFKSRPEVDVNNKYKGEEPVSEDKLNPM